MHPGRRDFLRLFAAAGSGAMLATATPELEGQAASEQGSTSEAVFDSAGVSFWTKLFQQPPSATLGVGQSGDERTPRFFLHTAESGFRFPTSPPVKSEELESMEHPSVKLRVLAFKASEADNRKFDASQSGTLRVDLLQAGMLNAGQPGSAASTAMSGLATNGAAKLQPTAVSGVRIGGEQAFSLPGGGGYLNWTFFLQKKDGPWHKVLTSLIMVSKSAASGFLPLMNIGGLAKNEWNGLNSMMGGLLPVNASQTPGKSTFWIFTPGVLQVAASQKAYNDPMFADGLPLIKGAHYIVVPQEHYKKFGDIMPQMMLAQGGYVVPAQTKPQDVFEAAHNTPELKDVSYLSVHCEGITAAEECGSGSSKAKNG